MGTCWKAGGENRTPPKGTRFSAHGGELGATWRAVSSPWGYPTMVMLNAGFKMVGTGWSIMDGSLLVNNGWLS